MHVVRSYNVYQMTVSCAQIYRETIMKIAFYVNAKTKIMGYLFSFVADMLLF